MADTYDKQEIIVFETQNIASLRKTGQQSIIFFSKKIIAKDFFGGFDVGEITTSPRSALLSALSLAKEREMGIMNILSLPVFPV